MGLGGGEVLVWLVSVDYIGEGTSGKECRCRRGGTSSDVCFCFHFRFRGWFCTRGCGRAADHMHFVYLLFLCFLFRGS